MSAIVKRSIILDSHKTSISLENAFWTALKEIAVAKKITIGALVMSIDAERQHANLS
jgi:predicted DNA-binding ribbon-helix-helix protein